MPMKFCTAIILNASYLKASFFKNTAYKTAVITARKSHATPTGEAVNEKSLSISIIITPKKEINKPTILSQVSLSLKIIYPTIGVKSGIVPIITDETVGVEYFNP